MYDHDDHSRLEHDDPKPKASGAPGRGNNAAKRYAGVRPKNPNPGWEPVTGEPAPVENPNPNPEPILIRGRPVFYMKRQW